MSSHNDLREQIGKLFEQAFTDGASDTMWQNDRHVEIYKTAVDKAMQAITATIEAEVAKSRIDELERTAKYAGAWFRGDERLVNWVNMEIIRDRLAELQAAQQQDSNKKEGLK